MKKVISLIMAIAMIACIFSSVAYAEEKDTSFVIGTGDYGYCNNPTKMQMTEVYGLGGKAADDSAMAFELDEEGHSISIMWHYPLSHFDESKIGTSGGSKGIYLAFNMYADGDPTVRITYRSSYEIITWKADGTAKVTGASEPVMLERGKWHRVVLSANDSNGGRIACFIDGERIAASADSGWGSFTGKSPLGFGFTAGSKNGIVAFDDTFADYWVGPDTYYSKKAQDVPSYVGAQYLTLDSENDVITFADEVFQNVDELAETVKSAIENADVVNICDAKLSKTASSLDEAKYAAVKLESGAYCYYELKKEQFTPKSVEFIESGDSVGAVSLFDNNTSTAKTFVMIFVMKDENGVIQKLIASPETTIEPGETNVEVLVEPVERNGLTAEVFFIKGWETRLRLLDDIYSE